LLDERENGHPPAQPDLPGLVVDPAREIAVRGLVVVEREGDLLQVVRALLAGGGEPDLCRAGGGGGGGPPRGAAVVRGAGRRGGGGGGGRGGRPRGRRARAGRTVRGRSCAGLRAGRPGDVSGRRKQSTRPEGGRQGSAACRGSRKRAHSGSRPVGRRPRKRRR